MKKLLTLGVMGTSLVAMTGCGASIPTVEIPDELTTENITIEFWHTMGTDNMALLDEMIEDFNVLYPNITVNHAAQGGFDDLVDKVAKAIPAGTQPQLTFCYPDHVALYNTGLATAPLNGFIEHEEFGFTNADINDFVEGFWNEGLVYDNIGTMYSMPFAKSTEAMFVNMDKLASVGYTEVPTSWDEVIAISKALEANGDAGYKFGYDSEANMFITMLEQKGIAYTSPGKFLFNSTAAKTFVTDFVAGNRNYIKTKETSNGEYTSTQFKNGDIFLTIGSTGGASYNNPGDSFKYEVAPIPQFDQDNKAVIQQGPSLAIMKDKDPQKMLASWLFLKHITNTDNSAAYAKSTGYFPVRQSSVNTTLYQEFISGTSIQAQALKAAEAQIDYYFTSAAFNGSSAARLQVGYIIEAVLLNTKTVDQAFAAAMEELEG